jgi:hypothetical protein
MPVVTVADTTQGFEWAPRYPDRHNYPVNEHNGLMTNTHYQRRLMEMTHTNMVPMNPIWPAFTLLVAKLHSLNV